MVIQDQTACLHQWLCLGIEGRAWILAPKSSPSVTEVLCESRLPPSQHPQHPAPPSSKRALQELRCEERRGRREKGEGRKGGRATLYCARGSKRGLERLRKERAVGQAHNVQRVGGAMRIIGAE